METLRGQLEIVEGQRAALAARVEELSELNEVQLRRSGEQIAALEKRLDEMRIRERELDDRLLTTEVAGKGLRRRLELLVNRLATATEREGELVREATILRTDMVAAKAAAESARAEAEAEALELQEYQGLVKAREKRLRIELDRESGTALLHDRASPLHAETAEEKGRAAATGEGEIAVLSEQLEARTAERDAVQRKLVEARTELSELRAKVEELGQRVTERQLEYRAVATDLIRTQGTLQARSEQLQRLLSSRWYRLARSSWQARRRRPPLPALLLFLLAIGGALATVLLATEVGALVAGLLGALIVVLAAATCAVVLPALRDQQLPRMAGEDSYANPLSSDPEALHEELAKPVIEVREQRAPINAESEADHERQRWLTGARTPDLGNLRVAAILDEMSRACFAPECDLDTGFTMHDWRERLQERPPHLLLVESAWNGNGGGWQYGVGSYAHPRFAGLPALRELVAWCREGGIPTVFWNKEDPVHFERFQEAAALFDHVFTTDADRIPAYRELGGSIRTVEPLPFAAQPQLHNPIPIVEERLPSPVFAGTYYRDRHPDRQRTLEAILDAARPHGLIIYDRTFGSDSEAYGFPERFLPHIKGRLSYAETVAAYKSHRVFLNVNSVVDSPTMFSRRVFELLACGTAVLSTGSAGMEATFGDLVPVATTEAEAAAALERLLEDDDYRRDLTGRAQRLVLGRHTYRDRLLTVARTAGFDLAPSSGEETTALIVADEREELEAAAKSLLTQSIKPDEVLLGLTNGVLVDRDLRQLSERFGDRIRSTAQEPGLSDSERLRELATLAATPWVAPLRPSVHYGENHLRDLLACTRFAEAEVIGFGDGGSGGHGVAHRYGETVSPDAAIADREVVAKRGWPDDSGEMRRWFAQGVRFYAGDSSGA